MDLFSQEPCEFQNLLPFDGTALYFGRVLAKTEADQWMNILQNSIEWKNDEAIIYGKKIITKRKVAWYGEEPFAYTYSKTTKMALPWTDGLLTLKQLAEEKTGALYNSCLLNLYHDGSEGMAWHSDAEKDLQLNGAIASMSFGAARKFAFRHKISKQTVSLVLEHGSLLLMKGTTQTHWLHRLPPSTVVHTPRINLTFRMIVK